MLALILAHFVDGDLGEYHELSTGVMVNQPGAEPSRVRALQSAFIHHMLVDQAFTFEAGRTIWGFPKVMADFTIRDGKQFGFDASIDGQLVAGMEFRRGLRVPSALTHRKQVLRSYSHRDGQTLETPFDMSMVGVRYRTGGVRVWLGNHPYAKELASLGLPKRAMISASVANVHVVRRCAGGFTMTTTKPDVDLTDGAFYAGDSRAVYKWMRENEPVFRDRNGLAAASTYQAVIDAERNPELFSNAGGIRPDQPGAEMMIEMDDPQHLLRRKLVNSGFTRKRVKDLEASIGSLCDALIDAMCERGECDFVWDLAAPLPMAVIGDMLGVLPEEREMFLKWSDDMVSFLSSTAAQEDFQVSMDAFAAYTEYMTGMLAARKEKPTDDLVSVLVHAEVEGAKLEDHQIVTEVLLLLIGGDETTRHTLSGGTRQLLRHPDQHQRLVNDLELLPNAIEEMLRWTAPVKNMARTINADTEFHGTALKEGEKMLLLFESANFDEKVFEDPESFNIDRYPNNHLAFGFGTHFCLGNQLARLELSIMQAKLLQRLPDMRLASDVELPLRPANFVSGLESMPVRFTPTKSLG